MFMCVLMIFQCAGHLLNLLTYPLCVSLLLQVVINVVQGFRPDVPEEEELPPGTSSSTCEQQTIALQRALHSSM
jgi:hypothetical protein